MRDLLPRRVFLASFRLRVERRFLADDFLPFSARTTLLRDALLRETLNLRKRPLLTNYSFCSDESLGPLFKISVCSI
jgi:hypothetical protein